VGVSSNSSRSTNKYVACSRPLAHAMTAMRSFCCVALVLVVLEQPFGCGLSPLRRPVKATPSESEKRGQGVLPPRQHSHGIDDCFGIVSRTRSIRLFSNLSNWYVIGSSSVGLQLALDFALRGVACRAKSYKNRCLSAALGACEFACVSCGKKVVVMGRVGIFRGVQSISNVTSSALKRRPQHCLV
jgi:hypothetical protein